MKEKLFDDINYSKYYPGILRLDRKAIILRNGLVFSNISAFRYSVYSYFYACIIHVMVAIASLIKRGVCKIEDAGEQYALIHSPWTAGYYHWLTEALPRAYVLRLSFPDAVPLLPRDSHRNFEDSLKALGYKRIAYFPSGKNAVLERCLITECPKNFATTDPELLNQLRSALLEKFVLTKKQSNRLVYISRSASRGRMVLNETKVVDEIIKVGGTVVYPETLSFEEQVTLFSECSIIIGNHGAGLTNMMFMPAGGVVIELLPYRNSWFDYRPVGNSFRHQSIFWRLADVCGHKHDFLLCRHNLSRFSKTDMASLYVDIEKLRSIIMKYQKYII